MRENRVDIVQASLLALLVHLVPLLLLLVASLWRAPQSVAAGEPIVAEVIDPNALSAGMRSALRRPPEPLQKPEPAPPEPPLPEEQALPEPLEETPPEQQLQPQEQLPDPDTVDQQEVKPDAAAEAAAAQREQEARRRQAQVDLTDERRRQEQAEQRQTEMQRQRDQQLADIRRQRAQAQSEAALAEERLRQLADQRARQASAAAAAAPPPGNRGTDPDLTALYRQALIDKIRSNWTQPDNVSPTQVCKIVIKQIPGGQVIDAQVDPSCPYDEAGQRSVEAAVLKAQPLPHKGFEAVFSRTLTLNFRAEDR